MTKLIISGLFRLFGSVNWTIRLGLTTWCFATGFGLLFVVCGAYAVTPPAPDRFAGKTVRSITIEIRDIFTDENINAIYRTANKLKINTEEEVVRRELLFKVGQPLTEFLINETERVLRNLKYLRKPAITPVIDGDYVDIHVLVYDTWTMIPQVTYSSGTGRDKRSAGLEESNLLGSGKRIEALYEETDNRNSFSAVWHDPRVYGSKYQLVTGVFDRNDGERFIGVFEKPFRSLVDKQAGALSADVGDTIGRLFDAGEEDFIFRQKFTDLTFRFTQARGDPSLSRRRFSAGYNFQEFDFTDAERDDFEDLDLDPADLNQDPARLAENRRFSGPLLAFELIEPQFFSRMYIDRFDRVEDFNLGEQINFTAQAAPEVLGSKENAGLFSGNRARGYRVSEDSFMRGEWGFSTRAQDGELQNSVIRTELKYYNVLGMVDCGDVSLGRHTLAANFFIDYGNDLDRDREFGIGADNALRGYEALTFTGNKRMALNLEDRVHLVDDLFQLISVGVAGFIDVGGASDNSLHTMVEDEMYGDFGFGLRVAFPRVSNSRVFRIDVAFPVRDGPDGSGSLEPRILFSGGQLFGAGLRSEAIGAEQASVGIGLDR